ncbi:MAG: tRNA pseudouridine(55) synthase TruB [Gemmatimonadota bacterium]|nr:tRNA pseudouridine(55) synthase TruB [Gemmatimonadota bacterium]
MSPLNTEPGLLLVDKPAGLTSHDVVRGARARLGEQRVGHTGTLDPFATGLLLLCVGSFTRATEYFHDLAKTYRAAMRLGRETTTDDLTGESVSESGAWRELSVDGVTDAVSAVLGPREQVPSTYSAKRVGGVRAYNAARAGDEVELKPVPIIVHEVVVREVRLPDVAFDVTVSTGTYVRALARDLGRELGCGGHLTSLRRSGIGPFDVADACPAEDLPRREGLSAPSWRPAHIALGWLGRRELTEAEAEEIGHGRTIAAAGEEGVVSLVFDGRLAAIAEVSGEELRPRKVFPA